MIVLIFQGEKALNPAGFTVSALLWVFIVGGLMYLIFKKEIITYANLGRKLDNKFCNILFILLYIFILANPYFVTMNFF